MNLRAALFLTFACIVNAVVLFFATLFLNSLPIQHPDDTFNATIITYLRELVLGIPDDTNKAEFAFINVAWSKQLIPKYDSLNDPIGVEPITNREELIHLFTKISSSPEKPRFILCDILFKDSTKFDHQLQAQISKFENILIPYERIRGEVVSPVVNAPSGLAEVYEQHGSFLKYHYAVSDSLKQIPLLMYEFLTGDKVMKKGVFLHQSSGQRMLNSFVPTMRFSEFDLKSDYKDFMYTNIKDYLENDSLYSLHDKILVIGDFEDRDMHSTMRGTESGALILVNAYLALIHQDNLLNFSLIIFLLACYAVVSFIALYPNDMIEATALKLINGFLSIVKRVANWVKRVFKKEGLLEGQSFSTHGYTKGIGKLITYSVLLFSVSLATYFIFNIYITTILYLAIELTAVGILSDRLNKKYYWFQNEKKSVQSTIDLSPSATE